MKNITLLACFLTIISFTNCGDDESNDISLVGNWIFSSQEYKNCTDQTDNDIYTEPCTTSDCITLSFNSDGSFEYTFLEAGVSEIEGGTYTISGNQLICGMYDDFWCESAGAVTFSISNNTLLISYSDDFPECAVEEIYNRGT